MNATGTRRRTPVAVPVAIVLAWAAAIVAHATGRAHGLHHDVLLGHGPVHAGALAAFAVAWVVMVAAMMLPSAVPLLRLFAAVSRHQPRSGQVLAAFVGGYLTVWTLFGWLAFGFDGAVHAVVDASPWLAARPWLVATGTLAMAGAFQFSALKDRCLDACRHPAAYLQVHYRRGRGPAFALGWGHGLFCLGCCWALMLVMFAAGVADLRWMAALGALMAYEKIGRRGPAVAAGAGVVLLGLASVTALHVSWLPGVLSAH
jgi:predicted metal-binding membrane protein